VPIWSVGGCVTTHVRRPVNEVQSGADVPLWGHLEWRDGFPWLVQGVAGVGAAEQTFDLGLFGEGRTIQVMARWQALRRATGATQVVHGDEVHGAAVCFHSEGMPGLHVSPATGGHASATPGVLLTVSVADCVPISLVDPERPGGRASARRLAWDCRRDRRARRPRAQGARPADLHVHLGPAICGDCYEVGPEVYRGLGLPEPPQPGRLDLRAQVAERALRTGVREDCITLSLYCTWCGVSPFFSHRGGRSERQVVVLRVSS
jgi:copper oxidase (laccase) domain-containing protein